FRLPISALGQVGAFALGSAKVATVLKRGSQSSQWCSRGRTSASAPPALAAARRVRAGSSRRTHPYLEPGRASPRSSAPRQSPTTVSRQRSGGPSSTVGGLNQHLDEIRQQAIVLPGGRGNDLARTPP